MLNYQSIDASKAQDSVKRSKKVELTTFEDLFRGVVLDKT